MPSDESISCLSPLEANESALLLMETEEVTI